MTRRQRLIVAVNVDVFDGIQQLFSPAVHRHLRGRRMPQLVADGRDVVQADGNSETHLTRVTDDSERKRKTDGLLKVLLTKNFFG